MRRIVILSLLAVATALDGAPAPFPTPNTRPDRLTGDLLRLQGEWEAVELADSNGRKLSLPGEEDIRIAFVISSRRTVVRIAREREEYEAELTLDTQADPKKFDLKLIGLRAVGERDFEPVDDRKGRDILLGLYRLGTDELTLCMDMSEKGSHRQRPASFTGARGASLLVCRRKR